MPEATTGSTGSTPPKAKAALTKAKSKPSKPSRPSKPKAASAPTRSPANWVEELYVLAKAGDARAKATIARIDAKTGESKEQLEIAKRDF